MTDFERSDPSPPHAGSGNHKKNPAEKRKILKKIFDRF